MLWEQLTGFVGALLVGLLTVGAVATYGLQTLTTEANLTAVGVVTILTAVAVLALIVAGSSATDELSNPYW